MQAQPASAPRRWRRPLLGSAVLLLAAVVSGAGSLYWLAARQGLPEAFWSSYKTAHVLFDSLGIPTIEAANWQQVAEAQGFVTASERLWQMDLLRRKAGGRLAEWFGEPAFAHDSEAQAEDRLGITRADVAYLGPEQRQVCEAYARGVNAFIAAAPQRWGLEYALLRVEPEPWSCADSLLIILEMADDLSSYAEIEAQQMAWRRNLSPAWQAFLFSEDHPWNRPLFGNPDYPGPPLPPPAEALAPEPLQAAGVTEEQAFNQVVPVDTDPGRSDPAAIGSNSWAWRGPTGAFLANDPHLGLSVPGIWYASRLRVAADDWLAGVSIPGVPLAVLGMNPYLAWAFTNTGEDVDDFLAETLSADGNSYQVVNATGATEWRPIERKVFAVKVKGEAAPRQVTALFTHRGPLARRTYLGDGFYSRQWLPLKPGRLRTPPPDMVRARDLAEFDAGADGFLAPSQNILIMDGQGAMGYRMAGTGVKRSVSGRWPQPAGVGEWRELLPPKTRVRRFLPAPAWGRAAVQAEYFATANARVAMLPFGGAWASDDRRERIDRYLGARRDFRREDMEALQLDTQSRFLQLLVRWVADRAAPDRGAEAETATQWRAWDGAAKTNPRLFTQATAIEQSLTKLLLGRVQATFKNNEDRQVPYTGSSRRGWLTAFLEAPGDSATAAFGLRSQDLARYLLMQSLRSRTSGEPPLHPDANRWQGQHPFVGRLPVLGALFRVSELPQWGAANLVLAETPKTGPSLRFVWDLRQPWQSTWVFPVGQSGHVLSPHYRDWHRLWSTGTRYAVFPDKAAWSFPGRG